MDFTTLKYLGFLGLVAVLYRLCPPRLRALLLLVASYAFYWTWSGWMATILLAATVLAFLAARALEAARESKQKFRLMFLAVLGLVGLLSFFKAEPLLRGLLGRNLIMPLGVSYYTFKLISYVVDVYWGKTPAERQFIPFAAYASFFPQIVAGPIQRSESFLTTMREPPSANLGNVVLGIQRILLGYLKKLVVADNLSILVNFVYGHVYDAGTPLILGFYIYPLQVYADFSGLTDIAVGSAWVLGIETPENFNAPFSSATPSEYWRRWHITLTTWLTDYVFTPLRMSTRAWGDFGLVFSLVINMVLIGIWHGFRWGFALFGLVHAFYLSMDALTARARKKYYRGHPAADQITDWVGPVVIFHLIALSFVFFRGADVESIVYLIAHLGTGIAATSTAFRLLWDTSGQSIAVGLGAYVLMEIADWFRRRNQRGEMVTSSPEWARWSVYSCTAVTVVFVVMLLLAGGASRNPFLYAIF